MRYWMLATAISMAVTVGLAFYGRWAGNEQFEFLGWVVTVLTLILAAVWICVSVSDGRSQDRGAPRSAVGAFFVLTVLFLVSVSTCSV